MLSTKSVKTLSLYLAAVCVTGLPAVWYVLQHAADDAAFGLVLRQTARSALYIYLLIFVLRPLQQLRPSGIGRSLLRNRRYIGVAFAGIMTAHLVLILWYRVFVVGEPIPPLSLLGGGGAYLLLLLMLITSFDGPARAIGPLNWRRLHKTGLYWIGVIFANTMIPDVISEPGNPFYLATALLMLIAIGIRVLAFARRRRSV
jgi:DMSO/TMAO reductase YedYZ heme-binding membrane subunit